MKKSVQKYYDKLVNKEATRHSMQNLRNYYKMKKDKEREYLDLCEAIARFDFMTIHNSNI